MNCSTSSGRKLTPISLASLLKNGFPTVLIFCVAFVSLAQDPAPATQQRPRQVHPTAQPNQADDTLRIDTDLVSVDVNVSDAQGRTVRNLQNKDFKLFEDDLEQPLAFFHIENKSGP